jgi:uncharacterized membrane protein (UPF0127 family)
MMRAARVFAALAVFVLVAAGLAPARAEGFEPISIVTSTGTHAFHVEIAKDDRSREIGLMNRRYMAADRGMLFEFDEEAPEAFWMKNTYIPLDIIFISRSGIVTRIAAEAEPLSESLIPSGPPCAAVLELNGGMAARIGLRVGDRIVHGFFKT